MGVDFLILFLLALAFWWFSGRVIDDVFERVDAQWWRAWAREDIGRRDRDAA